MNHEQFDAHRKTVATRCGDINYVDVGEGRTALFVHGVGTNAQLWRHAIDELRGEARCVALDLPLHGRTPAQPGQDFSLTALAGVVEDFCDALGLTDIDLVANDTGGAVAQIFAARHPRRLRTFTLTNCETHDNVPPEAFKPTVDLAAAGKLAPLADQLLTNLDLTRSGGGIGGGYEHPELLSEETIRGYLGPVFGTPGAARQFERFLTSLEPGDLMAVEPALRELTVPTLVVWGTGDENFDVKWAYWLRDTIPGVTDVIEVPGAKLFFPDERPADLVPHLRRHWAAH